MSEVRIVLWNVQADQRTAERTKRIRSRIAALQPDVVCLNEGFPSDVPDGYRVIISGLSDWKPELAGARKVLLAARMAWQDADDEGSPLLPEGRFVSGTWSSSQADLRVLGIAPPYHAYRTTTRWGDRRQRVWQGNETYWRALAADVLPHVCAPALIVGDFNIQLPSRNYPRPEKRGIPVLSGGYERVGDRNKRLSGGWAHARQTTGLPRGAYTGYHDLGIACAQPIRCRWPRTERSPLHQRHGDPLNNVIACWVGSRSHA